MSLLFMLGGIILFGLGGYNLDTWTENHHAANMVVAFIDIGLGLWWLLVGTKND